MDRLMARRHTTRGSSREGRSSTHPQPVTPGGWAGEEPSAPCHWEGVPHTSVGAACLPSRIFGLPMTSSPILWPSKIAINYSPVINFLVQVIFCKGIPLKSRSAYPQTWGLEIGSITWGECEKPHSTPQARHPGLGSTGT